ncbi:Chaperone protein dnaJ 20 [Abeliophyllum distichum]|uniref:Chaperone protein dnaJ 20 n=1 Tax=Abeliophyllum distichum TaxID=126358 RepID=A0ABD1T122_9LAMI
MCCNRAVIFPRSDPFHFNFIPSIRSDPLPSSISFRPRPAFRPLKSTYSDNISLSRDRPVSFYDLLGIPETGTQLEIKQAYKQLARKYHPDVSPPDRVQEYTERFIRVQEAYETLSDPRRRALYDRDMAKGLHLAFSCPWPLQIGGASRRKI